MHLVQARDDVRKQPVVFGAVEEVIDLEPEHIQPPPRIGTKIRTEFIKGMGKRDSQLIMILDIDRVFSTEELSVVRGAEPNQVLAEVNA